MGKLRTDRKALQAKLNIRRGSGFGRAIKKVLLTKTPVKVTDRGLKMTEMNSYEKIYLMLTENETVEEGIKKKIGAVLLGLGAVVGGAKALKTKTPTTGLAPGISIEKAGDALDKPMFSQEQSDRVDQALERARRSRKLRARIEGKGK